METLLTESEKKLRQQLLGHIHQLARQRFGKAIGNEYAIADIEYRAWLEKHFKERSCVRMNNETLQEVLATLKVDQPNVQDIAPKLTKAQYLKIVVLCKQMGWNGPDDVRFRRFCERTVKQRNWTVEFDLAMLRRADATAVITGLTNWCNQIQRPFECHNLCYES